VCVCNYVPTGMGSILYLSWVTGYESGFSIKPADAGLKTLYPRVSNLLPSLFLGYRKGG
jgi:hypothetical protein